MKKNSGRSNVFGVVECFFPDFCIWYFYQAWVCGVVTILFNSLPIVHSGNVTTVSVFFCYNLLFRFSHDSSIFFSRIRLGFGCITVRSKRYFFGFLVLIPPETDGFLSTPGNHPDGLSTKFWSTI